MKCFNNCKAPVVTKISGSPVCEDCFNRYMGYDQPQLEKAEYIMSDVAVDLRGF